MNLPQGKMESCTLRDVLVVPDLAYNLLSTTSASKKGKVTTFSEMRCEIRDPKSKLIASGHREGSLYYLDHGGPIHQASHWLPFQLSTVKRAEHPLELIHSDVCGEIGARSLGGGEYFVMFVDDHT